MEEELCRVCVGGAWTWTLQPRNHSETAIVLTFALENPATALELPLCSLERWTTTQPACNSRCVRVDGGQPLNHPVTAAVFTWVVDNSTTAL